MLIITGATGTLGHQILDQLLQRVTPDQVAVSVRDPDAVAERGIRVRRGDFNEPESLRHAFEGASQVLIISSNTAADEAVRQHRNAIDAAVAVGARRILYTSHMGANPASPFPPMRDHAATEAALQESGIAFTSLRNGFYASTVRYFVRAAVESGSFALPPDGPVSWTAHADLAEAAAIAVADEGRLDGITPPLTASQALDFTAVAQLSSEVTGSRITRTTTSDDDFRATLRSHGAPEAQVDMTLSIFAASRAGEFAAVDPTLEQLLGRRPQSLRDVLAADQ